MAASRRVPSWLLLAIIAVPILAVGVVAFIWWKNQPVDNPPRAKLTQMEIVRLNNKGVGLMEMFKYAEAVKVFREIAENAPDWQPGKINLGIALLNSKVEGHRDEAIEQFEAILKEDPENLYCLYCLGILSYEHVGGPEGVNGSVAYLRKVTKKDPDDPHAWWRLGLALPGYSKEQVKAYATALEKDPYLRGALYGLQQSLRAHDEKKSKYFLKRLEEFVRAGWENKSEVQYTYMGKYATVIGGIPMFAPVAPIGPLPLFEDCKEFSIILAPGVRWAKTSDFGNGELAQLKRAVRKRFGATIVVLDFDCDDKEDLLLLAAVVDNGEVRDLLLHNEGNSKFRDVTKELGLPRSRASFGCTVGDFNNDGYPDLTLTGAGDQRLFRNTSASAGGRRFEDVSAKAGLNKITTICLGSMWIDLDQDSDLDLLLCQCGTNNEKALLNLESNGKLQGFGIIVFLNVGESPPAKKKENMPLTVAFRREPMLEKTIGNCGAAIQLAASDLDHDYDLDLIAVTATGKPNFILNDRLLHFHPTKLPRHFDNANSCSGCLVFNCNKDERSDLFFLRHGKNPLYFINQHGGREKNAKNWFETGATNSPPLLHAQTIDVDLDGRMDITGLSEIRRPVFLHNDSQRLVHKPDTFGAKSEFGTDLVAVSMFDANGDCHPDLLTWSEAKGLRLKRNQKNTNHALRLRIKGMKKNAKKLRTNMDGFGVWVTTQAGAVRSSCECTTLSAGLGQSRQVLLMGIGPETRVETLRLRWPDNIWQAEMNIPHCNLLIAEQISRYPDSCPLLFTWNGERYVFVTDMLGAGAMGELMPDRSCRKPRPTESVKIEANQLKPKDGRYQLQIAEPRDEVTYLDRAELVVVDHPEDACVYPDERFVSNPAGPSEDLLVFENRKRVFPARVVDHQRIDVTKKLRKRDRDTVDQFAHRAWLGYAEDHWIDLDFGDRLANFDPKKPMILCLAGWTDYPYPEAMWAAKQADVQLQAPILQRLGNDGQWQTILPEMGFPAGLPRMITVDVTGKVSGPKSVLRIRTNMQVYWNQIFLVPVEERISANAAHGTAKRVRVQRLSAETAKLSIRGFMQEFSPDGKSPTIFDFDRSEPVATPRIRGRLTRLGTVTELVHRRDDRFVILGPGDSLALTFKEKTLPPLRTGWTRSFVLRAIGYSKSCGPFIADGGTVFPLPFQAMTNYPYGKGEHFPTSRAHQDYLRRYLTREIGR